MDAVVNSEVVITGAAVAIVLFGCLTAARLIAQSARNDATGDQRSPVFPITASDLHAIVIDESRSWTRLVPNGRYVFFPKAHANAVYELKLTGLIQKGNGRLADAFHEINNDGNFTYDESWLRVNGQRLAGIDCEFVEQDRYQHRYVIRVAPGGDRLTLSLDRGWGNLSWHGSLTAEVTLLPPDTVTGRQRREREAKQTQQEAERDQLKLEAVAEAARFAQIVKDLAMRAETERNWCDPEFQQKFARVHGKELLENQAGIRKEVREFLDQHRLVAYLNRHNPGVVETILGRFHALLAAERLALDTMITAAAQKPPEITERPKSKLSAEQVKALKLRKQQIQLGDKVALAMDRIETVENVKTHVRAQYAHLAEDEQARIIQDILDQIDEEGNQNGKTL